MGSQQAAYIPLSRTDNSPSPAPASGGLPRSTSVRSSLDSVRDAIGAAVSNNDQDGAQAGWKVPAWAIVGSWIGLSTAVILYNRSIMVDMGFPYPVTLTTLHLLFQTIATRLLHRYTNLIASVKAEDYDQLPASEQSQEKEESDRAKAEETRRLKDASVEMDWDTWKKTIFPPAALFSLSLVLSNWAYLFLSTAYIHMLKAGSPVAILLAAFLFQTKAFSWKLLGIVVVISFGVAIASYGEANLSWIGFGIQVLAIAVEATRVTLIQILLAGKDMSPLKSLYYFAPICLAINGALVIPVEGFAALAAIPKLGVFTIVSNCALTLLLNLSSVYLISISSMVLSLSKVVKDILLVGGSGLLLGDHLSLLQVGGYAIATVGLFWYKANA